jgi:uncharacterized repeat protein (TIGR01451 family)
MNSVDRYAARAAESGAGAKFGTTLVACLVLAFACTVNSGPSGDEPGTESGGRDATGGRTQGEAGASPTSSGGTAGEAAQGEGGSPSVGTAGAGGVVFPSDGGARADGGTTGGGDAGSPSADAGETSNPPPAGSAWPDDGRGTTGPLVFEVTTARGPATPGKPLLWTLTVGNTAERAVEGVSVLFRVPEGLEFYYTTDADPDSSSCGNGTCSANEEATWAIGSLAPGSTQSISINTGVLASVGDGDALRAAIRLSATDVNPLNIMKSVPVVSAPPVQVSLTADQDPVKPGDRVELAFDIGQIGDTSLYEGELKAFLPPGLAVDTIGQSGTTASDGAIVWSIGDLPVGSTFRRTVSATVRDHAVPGDVLNPTAALSFEDADSETVAALPISVVEKAPPVSFTIDAASAPAVPGGTVLYHATISNPSLRAVENLELILRVPSELSYYYTTNAQPDSSSCGNGTCSGNEEAHWTIDSLPAGTTQTITLNPGVVAAAAGDGSLITPSFRLRGSGMNPINRFHTLPTNAEPGAELVLGTAVEPVVPGQSFTYDLHVGHVGTASLNGAVLKAYLPEGVSIDSISDGGAATDEREVTWDLDAISVGTHAYRSVTVTVDEDVVPAAVLEATAVLTYDEGAEIDATAQHALSVVEAPLPLTVSVEAIPDPVVLGERILYTTTLTNTSERAVDGIVLLMRLPEGTSFYYTTDADPDSSSCGNGTCSATEEAFWEIGTLSAGELLTVTTNAQVAASLVGGSLVSVRQNVTAANLGGTINLQTTIPTEN